MDPISQAQSVPRTSHVRVGKHAVAAGIADRPRAGEERADTLSRYGADVQVSPSPPVV